MQLCGQTTRDDCPDAATNFKGEGTRCADQPLTCDEFRLRPCCTATNATCEIVTKGGFGAVPVDVNSRLAFVSKSLGPPHSIPFHSKSDMCDFVEGIWNDNAELCSEVNCLKDVCAFTLVG